MPVTEIKGKEPMFSSKANKACQGMYILGEQGMGIRKRRDKAVDSWIRIAAAAFMTAAVSGLVEVYGLEEVVFFNKGAVSLGVFILGFVVVPKAFGHWREDRRKFSIGYWLSFGLVFTEILGGAMRLEETRGGVALTVPGVVFMAASALVLALAVEPCFYMAVNMEIKPGKVQREAGIGPGDGSCRGFSVDQVFLVAWGVLFLGYLPCALAFYPGLYCYDMSWQWAQFASGAYTTHHPLLHTILSGAVIELGKFLGGSYERGLFFHSLVQLAFLSGCMAFGIRFLAKRRAGVRAILFVGAFFVLFPYFPVMGISTTKDTVFAGLFFVVFVCLCDMVWDRAFYKGKKLALFVLCCWAMCLFRNNGVYGLAVMACCLAAVWLAGLFSKRGWRKSACSAFLGKAIGLLLCCILISQGGAAALEKGLDAEKGSRAEMLSLPMQQMARAYVYHREEFPAKDKEKLLTFFDEESILSYQYYVSDPVKAGMDMEAFKIGDFARLWLRLGKRFPGEYAKATLYNMMGLWYMGGDSSCFMAYEMLPPFDEEHWVEARSLLPRLKAYYCWFTDENLQKYLPGLCLFFYTSFYSWCVPLAAGIMAGKRKYLSLILPLFLCSYGFTLVFGPCIIIRYFLAVMMCVPLLAVMAFLSPVPEGFGTAGGPP